jgi:hypothetical protein
VSRSRFPSKRVLPSSSFKCPLVPLKQAWNKDPGLLSALCDSDPGCAGFNSNGWIKANVSNIVSSPGTTLWIKKAAVAAAGFVRNDAGIAVVLHAAAASRAQAVPFEASTASAAALARTAAAPETSSLYASSAKSWHPRGPQPPGKRLYRVTANGEAA